MENNKWVYGEGNWGNWYSADDNDEGYDDREDVIIDGLEFSMSTNNDFVYIGQVKDNSVVNVEQIEVESLLKDVVIG